ncbi:MAG: hypothetical protein GY714_09155 [Desulfobacterales bacterium]|nr:hypothetical protein [Desulfobacterales bacterium]
MKYFFRTIITICLVMIINSHSFASNNYIYKYIEIRETFHNKSQGNYIKEHSSDVVYKEFKLELMEKRDFEKYLVNEIHIKASNELGTKEKIIVFFDSIVKFKDNTKRIYNSEVIITFKDQKIIKYDVKTKYKNMANMRLKIIDFMDFE